MKQLAFFLLVPWLLTDPSLWAQDPANDLMGDHLFPPDFVMQQERAVNLTAEQRVFIQAENEKMQSSVQGAERLVRECAEKLATLVQGERINEQEALPQLDKLLASEREIRRSQLSLLIRIKNRLTAQQQAKLQELKTGFKTLEPRVRQVQAGVERWQQEGRDPWPIVQIMQELEPLVREGHLKEAEGVLDRALKALGDKKEK